MSCIGFEIKARCKGGWSNNSTSVCVCAVAQRSAVLHLGVGCICACVLTEVLASAARYISYRVNRIVSVNPVDLTF